ncbi:DUF4304 domain-containing protein [Croceicoccus bisphenolivorans]|uniref:DUF4304 domain-containing protein n=1 Tax=Croceicoccus bisphenolivorans TaxID=1783232 RepID=UPI00082CD68D|nr:DUF4304 domain-containing protein [Croceicoccus bisphenolivorans]
MADAAKSNRHVRAAIRELLEPELVRLGFDGKYPEFHRLADGQWHGFAIRTDKYGGGFSTDMARSPFSEARYRRLLKSDPSQAGLPAIADHDRKQRARLWHEGEDGSDRHQWSSDFRYDDIRDDRDACRALVGRLVALLPEADAWLRTGKAGPHVDADFKGPPGRPGPNLRALAADTVKTILGAARIRPDKDGIYRG